MSLGVDLVLAVQPTRAWRCHPDAPPFSLAAPAVLSARARTMPLMRPMTLPIAGKRLCRGTRPSTKAHSGAAAIVQSGRVHVSIAILASDGGLKLLVELPLFSIVAASFIACRSQRHNGIPRSCCCGATRQHLCFEQMKGYP